MPYLDSVVALKKLITDWIFHGWIVRYKVPVRICLCLLLNSQYYMYLAKFYEKEKQLSEFIVLCVCVCVTQRLSCVYISCCKRYAVCLIISLHLFSIFWCIETVLWVNRWCENKEQWCDSLIECGWWIVEITRNKMR